MKDLIMTMMDTLVAEEIVMIQIRISILEL